MRKKVKRFLSYIILFFISCLFLALLFLLGIWLTFRIKESITLNPSKNINIVIRGLSFYPGIHLKKVIVQSIPQKSSVELDNIRVKISLPNPFDGFLSVDNCKFVINTSAIMMGTNGDNTGLHDQGEYKANLNKYIKYIPRQVNIQNISLFIVNEGGSARLDGVRLEIDKLRNIASLYGDKMLLDINYNNQSEKLTGSLNFQYQLSQNMHKLKTYMRFEPHLIGSGEVTIDGKAENITVDNMSWSLDKTSSRFLSGLISPLIGMPLSWEKLELNHLAGKIKYDKPVWVPEEMNGELLLDSLVIGDSAKPWISYTSKLTIHTATTPAEGITIVEMSTQEEPKCKLLWKYEYQTQNLEISFATDKPIKNDYIQKIFPYEYDAFWLGLFAPFEVTLSSNLKGEPSSMQGTLEGKAFLSGEEAITVNSNLSFNLMDMARIKWQGAIHYLKHPIQFIMTGLPHQDFNLSFQTKNIPMKYLNKLVPSILVKPFDKAQGSCTFDLKGNLWEEPKLNIEGTIQPAQEEEEFLPIVPSQCVFMGVLKNLQMAEGKFTLNSENSVVFELNPCKLQIFPLSLEGDMKTKVYLSTISSEFMPIYIPGKADINGKLSWNGGMQIRVNGSGTAEGIGLSGYTLPEGVVLHTNADVLVDFSNYGVTIEQMKIGIDNNMIGTVEKTVLNLPQNDRTSYFSTSQISIQGDVSQLQTIGVSPESKGNYSLQITDLNFAENQLLKGNIRWNVNIENYEQPAWKIKIQNILTEGYIENIGENAIPLNITLGPLNVTSIFLNKIENIMKIRAYPFQMIIDKIAGELWGGVFEGKGVIQKEDTGLVARMDGNFRDVDLSIFTKEIQPPWIKLTGITHGSFDFNANLMTGELVDGTLNIVCPKGLTINRDVLMQLILYLQNVSIVQKQLEKLVGQEDPKPFDNGELNIGFKNDKATVSLLLSTPNLNLAPIFYINADWKMLWSLLTTPSNVQIEIQ